MTKQFTITKKGNAVGFTLTGRTVVADFSRKYKVWRVWTQGNAAILTNSDRQSFPTLPAARRYAESLIDDAKTRELKWW